VLRDTLIKETAVVARLGCDIAVCGTL